MHKGIFQPGQRVRIRQWDDMVNEYGTSRQGNINTYFAFTRNMSHLCGEEFTISSISINGSVSFEEEPPPNPDGDCFYWSISADMLEPVIITEIDESEFMAILNN